MTVGIVDDVLNPESDLYQALDHNGLRDLLDTVTSVELEIVGAADDWHWIVKLEDDTYAYITGACGFVGTWDDEESACDVVDGAETLEDTLALVDEDTRAIFREMLEDGDTQRDAYAF